LLFSQLGDGHVWSEALLILLGIIGAFGHIKNSRTSQPPLAVENSFLVWNTLTVIVLLSLIPYKTPWNILVFWGGMILLAGQGLVVVFKIATIKGQKILIGVLMLIGLAHLGWQSAVATGKYEASPLNPYVYAHTSTDLQRLINRLHQFAKQDSRGYELPIQVIAPGHDYWPLPWDLRDFDRIEWWDSIDTTATPADIIVLRTTAFDRETMEFDLPKFIYGGFPAGEKQLYSYLFDNSVSLRPGVDLTTLVKHDILDQSPMGTEW